MPLWPLRSETPEGVEDERERISKIRARPPVRLRAVHTTGAADGAESATREREVVSRKVGHMPRHYPVITGTKKPSKKPRRVTRSYRRAKRVHRAL